MTNKQTLTIRDNEIRERMNAIAGLADDAMTDEIRTEETALQVE